MTINLFLILKLQVDMADFFCDISRYISISGHAAMETAVCNLVEPGDKVLVCVNGLWGERFADMVQRHG